MNQDRNLTATFSLPIFKLTLETSGGGVVTGGGDFPFGTSVSYSATADDKYVFKNWMIDDQIHSNENSGLINISSDVTLTAYFEKSLDPALSTAQSLGNNIFSSWLGYFLTFENGWYYHLKLGWIYPQEIQLMVYGFGFRMQVGFGPTKKFSSNHFYGLNQI